MPARGASGGGDSIFAASVFNVGARSWEALVNLATVPVLLAHLGTEAYGLIGFTQSIFGVLGLLDFGLSNAVNRELAKREVDGRGLRLIRETVRSLELPLLGVAGALALLFVALAGTVAAHFLRVESLAPETVVIVLQLFAGIFLFRWVAGFYRGVFFGLERQVSYNVFSVIYTTLRFVGGAALLVAGKVGIVGLFVWYLGMDVLLFAALRVRVLAFERAGSRSGPSFSLARLRGVMPYAIGTMGLAVVGVLVMQVDKLLIARARPLSELGAYVLAFSLAMGIRIIPGAVWAAAFPRLVHGLQGQDLRATAEVLTATFRVSSLSALAFAAPLTVFASDIVQTLGARAAGIALAAPLLALLAMGAFVESLNGPCYQQMLAAGHARVLLRLNLMINLVFVAVMWGAIVVAGAMGAAVCWLGLQLAYFALYARKARELGGPDFAGSLRAIAPFYLLVVAGTGVVRLVSAGVGPIIGTGLAAAVSVVVHLVLGWQIKHQRGGVLAAG